MAMLAVFVRFAKNSRGTFDNLRDNAYGIYLVQYAFVSWLRYAMLKSHLSGISKTTILFSSVVGLGWITIAALRRIPAVARIV